MFDLDEKKVKCALSLAVLFFALSHPYVYRVCHNAFSATVSFLDMNGCPTEFGVFIMAIVFAVVIYNAHNYFSIEPFKGNKKNKANNGNNQNKLIGKCRTYCEQVSQEMVQENAMMNNIANQNNNGQAVQNNQMANNQGVNNQRANNQMANNQRANNQMVNNNVAVANNGQMNQNRMNNSMMNNQLQNNVANAPMPSVNLNNASNLGMDNLNTGSTDMGLLNSQSCSDNPQCSGGGGSQLYEPNLSNVNQQGGMFTENTTYHDDMYASLF
jgi:hypothetical protein